MKKRLSYLVVALVIGFLFMPNVFAASQPVRVEITDVKTSKVSEMVFANGTPITINERTDGQPGAEITWEGATETIKVGPHSHIFGGSHNDDTPMTTSITMNGGSVRNVFGGGLHKSHVTTSNVVINGGEFMGAQGGGAASLIHDAEYPTSYYAGAAADSPCRVDNANLIINGGKLNTTTSTYTLIYGGGEGISYTGKANLEVNAGTWDYVTAGGSNGYTGDATVEVTGGTIKVLQSVNRGSMDSAETVITGGTIEKAYVGGENDASVTGTIEEAIMSVEGGIVKNLLVGTNGGPDNPATDVAIISYNEKYVENIDTTEFDQDNIQETVTVTIDFMGHQESVEVPKGSVLTQTEIDELHEIDLESLGLDGYVLDGYYADEEYKTKYDFTAAFDQDVVIYMHAVEKPKTPESTNPDTADMNVTAVVVTLILASLGLAYTVRKRFN